MFLAADTKQVAAEREIITVNLVFCLHLSSILNNIPQNVMFIIFPQMFSEAIFLVSETNWLAVPIMLISFSPYTVNQERQTS